MTRDDMSETDVDRRGRAVVESINALLEAPPMKNTPEGGPPPAPQAKPSSKEVDLAPIVRALGCTEAQARLLWEAAQESEGFAGMSPQELAGKLASDDVARAELERRALASKGEPSRTPVGGISDRGIAAWPGGPAVGAPAMPEDTGGGIAPWPK